MAAYLNRGMSMIAGNGYGDSLMDPNSRREHHHVNSPLQIFVKAKKNINDIFGDISDYVVESTNFIEGSLCIYIHCLLILINIFMFHSIFKDLPKVTLTSSIKLKQRHLEDLYSKLITFGKYWLVII